MTVSILEYQPRCVPTNYIYTANFPNFPSDRKINLMVLALIDKNDLYFYFSCDILKPQIGQFCAKYALYHGIQSPKLLLGLAQNGACEVKYVELCEKFSAIHVSQSYSELMVFYVSHTLVIINIPIFKTTQNSLVPYSGPAKFSQIHFTPIFLWVLYYFGSESN